MNKRACKKGTVKGKKTSPVSYRIKCKRTANGLSHYIPSEKKALV